MGKTKDSRSRGFESNITGLLFEQKVSNYFVDKGWSPKSRVTKHGFNYDLYAERRDFIGLSAEYLVVECKKKGLVSAKDVVRFMRKVNVLYENLPDLIPFGKPPLHAYLCYTDEIDNDAAAVAKKNKPSIVLLQIK